MGETVTFHHKHKSLGRVAREQTQLLEETNTFSPQQRNAMHAAKYEKEFNVVLNMTYAHESGLPIGFALDMDTDFIPISVRKIKKIGLLEDWNKKHPDKALLIGDEIVKVNDILWHHNTRTFAERIKGQFTASRSLKKGAKLMLTLGVQRPHREKEVRSAAQREDLHRQLYSKDFTVDIPMGNDHKMGWQLNSSVDWMPVSISEISKEGALAAWNKQHPESKVLPGDEIIQ